MLVVKECIRSVHSNKPFIPFRRCLLTLALKPIFFGNCYTAFICTVSCNHNEYYQMDSIRFASALYKPYDNTDDKVCNPSRPTQTRLSTGFTSDLSTILDLFAAADCSCHFAHYQCFRLY